MGDIALIGEQLAEQSLAEVGHGLTVIHIAGSELEADHYEAELRTLLTDNFQIIGST